tara:strand:+ start:294 stop:896 length:603 start_codon:yes stop_codon:yes gene_type:complete
MMLALLAVSPMNSLQPRTIARIEASHVHADARSITKHFQQNKFGTTGMTAKDAFRHELAMYEHLQSCQEECSMMTFVSRLVGNSRSRLTLTFPNTGSVMLCDVRALYNYGLLMRWLDSLSDALNCCGIVHCDLQPKNIGVGTNNKFYVFDFDMAYLKHKQKPKNMGCPFDSQCVNASYYKSAFDKALVRPCVARGLSAGR